MRFISLLNLHKLKILWAGEIAQWIGVYDEGLNLDPNVMKKVWCGCQILTSQQWGWGWGVGVPIDRRISGACWLGSLADKL